MENSLPSSPGANNKGFKFSQFNVSTVSAVFKDIAFVLTAFVRKSSLPEENPSPAVYGEFTFWMLSAGAGSDRAAVSQEKNESKLKGLLETIEHLGRNVDYEGTIQKLEVGRR